MYNNIKIPLKPYICVFVIFDYILRDAIKHSNGLTKIFTLLAKPVDWSEILRIAVLFPSATIIPHIRFSFPPVLRKAHYLPCIINR